MKRLVFLLTTILSLSLLSLSVKSTAQNDLIYGIRSDGSTKIIKMDLDPNTGSYSGSYIIVKNINYSAALGLSPNGYFYYIGGTYGNSNGKFDLYAVKADGSTHTKVLNNYDGNGNNNNDLSFVRLGSTKNGLLVIVSKNENDNKIFTTTVQTNTDGSVQTPTNYGELTVSGGQASTFKNGDLVVDNNDKIYVLANNDGSKTTEIYQMMVSELSTTKVLTKVWTLVDKDGNKFDKRVNGLAWSSTGSLFVSDDQRMYFVDQNTVNLSGPGTVKAKAIKNSPDYLTDLASNFWTGSKLPVIFNNEITAKNINGKLVINFSTQSENNNDKFEVLASNNGEDFIKIAEIKSKAVNGNSSSPINYEVEIPLSGLALGMSAFALLGISLIPNKRNRFIAGVIAFIIAGTLFACSKNSDSINIGSETNYKFVKVVQVDKDGTSKESKVISIVKN